MIAGKAIDCEGTAHMPNKTVAVFIDADNISPALAENDAHGQNWWFLSRATQWFVNEAVTPGYSVSVPCMDWSRVSNVPPRVIVPVKMRVAMRST